MTTTRYVAYLLPAVFATLLVTAALAQDSPQPRVTLKQAARDSFAIGDATQARRHLNTLAEMGRQRFQDRGESGAHEWFQGLMELAGEYLRGGQLADHDHADRRATGNVCSGAWRAAARQLVLRRADR